MDSTREASNADAEIRASILGALGSEKSSDFYAGVSRLSRTRELIGAASGAFISDVAAQWSTNGISNRVQSERLLAIVERLREHPAALESLRLASEHLPLALRSFLAGVLPPVSRQRPAASTRQPNHVDVREDDRGTYGAAEGPTSRASELVSGSSVGVVAPGGTVILLTQLGSHEANKALLDRLQYGVVVWDSLAKLETDLLGSTDVCGFIVDNTFLVSLSADEQTSLFRLVGGHSSFSWIRVDTSGLKINAAAVRHEVKAARCARGAISSEAMSFQPDGRVREAELGDLAGARDALLTFANAQFVPGELSADECRLLIAAARDHAQELKSGDPVRVDCLETRFLAGGYSSARLVQIRLNRRERDIVAKVDSRSAVSDEIRRFQQFIRPWDDQLQPRAYFHGPAAAILFGLVSDNGDARRPAEMLEGRLFALWNDQLLHAGNEERAPRIEERTQMLSRGVEQAAVRLADLNRLAPSERSNFPSLANPDVSYFDRLGVVGIDWNAGVDAAQARAQAARAYERLATAAIVHGDVHLRNILLRGDTDPHLIDYAGSGPGHPAIDLVRLELALYLRAARHVDTYDASVRFQREVSLTDCSADDLLRQFAAFQKCAVNVVVTRGIIAARNACLAVLRQHGGTRQDYWAAKYLVSWQYLVMHGVSTSGASAIIQSLTSTILA